MTKMIFLCFFYSALVPWAYFMAAFALFNTYWADKYLLLRRWAVQPKIDASIVATTRMHLALVLLVHCVITQHYFAGWPFDEVGSDEATHEVDNVTYYPRAYKGDCMAGSRFTCLYLFRLV